MPAVVPLGGLSTVTKLFERGFGLLQCLVGISSFDPDLVQEGRPPVHEVEVEAHQHRDGPRVSLKPRAAELMWSRDLSVIQVNGHITARNRFHVLHYGAA